MGIVNEYIDKIVKFIKKENYEYPWQQYYKDMPRHLNYFEGSIYDKLKETASNYPNYIAIRYFDTEYTFREFMKMIDDIASSLMSLDIVENECVT